MHIPLLTLLLWYLRSVVVFFILTDVSLIAYQRWRLRRLRLKLHSSLTASNFENFLLDWKRKVTTK